MFLSFTLFLISRNHCDAGNIQSNADKEPRRNHCAGLSRVWFCEAGFGSLWFWLDHLLLYHPNPARVFERRFDFTLQRRDAQRQNKVCECRSTERTTAETCGLSRGGGRSEEAGPKSFKAAFEKSTFRMIKRWRSCNNWVSVEREPRPVLSPKSFSTFINLHQPRNVRGDARTPCPRLTSPIDKQAVMPPL